VLGYWLTRFLDETCPGLLVRLLARRRRPRDLERDVAEAVGLPAGAFWTRINGRVAEQFG